jgi:hypothetical protein
VAATGVLAGCTIDNTAFGFILVAFVNRGCGWHV